MLTLVRGVETPPPTEYVYCLVFYELNCEKTKEERKKTKIGKR